MLHLNTRLQAKDNQSKEDLALSGEFNLSGELKENIGLVEDEGSNPSSAVKTRKKRNLSEIPMDIIGQGERCGVRGERSEPKQRRRCDEVGSDDQRD